MGLTQDEEAGIGADVFIEDANGWTGGFIQYKAMHRQPNGALRWNLNRTTHKDQHTLLCILENAGYPVFYCFPMFDDAGSISAWSPPSLYKKVTWIRPNAIGVPAPVDAHHHVECVFPPKGSKPTWNVYSVVPTPVPGKAFATFEEVEAELLARPIKGALSAFIRRAARLVPAASDLPPDQLADTFEKYRQEIGDITRGLNLLAFGPAKAFEEEQHPPTGN